jgi:AcrR family transcriptional regulator
MTVVSRDTTVILLEVKNLPSETFFNLPEDKRNLIIEVTLDEFFEFGYQKASIARIVERSEISRGSFYQYFVDKRDLYKYIITEVISSKKYSYSKELMKDMDRMEFVEIVRQLFISGIRFYRDYPKMAVIATDFMRSRDEKLRNEVIGGSYKKSNVFFTEMINDRKSKNEIDKSIDSKILNYLITSLSISFSEYLLENDNINFNDDQLLEVVDKMVFILKNGLTPKCV